MARKTFVTASFIRLLKEAESGGYIDRRGENTTRELIRLSHSFAKESKDTKLTESLVLVVLNELAELVAKVRVEMAIHRRIMDVLMKWLSERGQRLAYRELSSIRIKNILRG